MASIQPVKGSEEGRGRTAGRLDRVLTKLTGASTASARVAIVEGHVRKNGVPVRAPDAIVSRFDGVTWGERVVQSGMERVVIMVHKPPGVVSATCDAEHRTVVDLIEHPARAALHLAGRLDRSATGLVLLTNDGRLSEGLTRPGSGIEKVYRVEVDRAIPEDAVARFQEGFRLEPEGVRTRPARLEPLGPNAARVTLVEGRWHQVKRMFHRLGGLRLTALHRERIGPVVLPDDLLVGRWRQIRPESAQVSTAREH